MVILSNKHFQTNFYSFCCWFLFQNLWFKSFSWINSPEIRLNILNAQISYCMATALFISCKLFISHSLMFSSFIFELSSFLLNSLLAGYYLLQYLHGQGIVDSLILSATFQFTQIRSQRLSNFNCLIFSDITSQSHEAVSPFSVQLIPKFSVNFIILGYIFNFIAICYIIINLCLYVNTLLEVSSRVRFILILS